MIHSVELTASRYQGRPVETQSRLELEAKKSATQADPLLDDALLRLVRLARASADPFDMEALGVLLNHVDSLEKSLAGKLSAKHSIQKDIVLQGAVTLTL